MNTICESIGLPPVRPRPISLILFNIEETLSLIEYRQPVLVITPVLPIFSVFTSACMSDITMSDTEEWNLRWMNAWQVVILTHEATEVPFEKIIADFLTQFFVRSSFY